MISLLRKILSNLKRRLVDWLYSWLEPKVSHLYFGMLIRKTNNFADTKWLGKPIWQNTLDLWTIQETISEIRPELIIECGTNRGGSSFHYAQLMDLLGHGRIITMDIEKMHDLSHPRVTYLIGDSCSDELVSHVRDEVNKCTGPIFVILDSDHSKAHVARELQAYHSFVTPGSFLLVQDGVIDVQECFKHARPGPLPAIEEFMQAHPEFQIDTERCNRFLLTHHPKGWLRRN